MADQSSKIQLSREDSKITSLRESFEGLGNVLRKRWQETATRVSLLEGKLVENPNLLQSFGTILELEKEKLAGLGAERQSVDRSFMQVAKALSQNPRLTLSEALKRELCTTQEALRKRTAAEYRLLDRERHATVLTHQSVNAGDMSRDTMELLLAILPAEEAVVRFAAPLGRAMAVQLKQLKLPEPVRAAGQTLIDGTRKAVEDATLWIRESHIGADPVPAQVGGGWGKGYEIEMPQRPRPLYSVGLTRSASVSPREAQEILGALVRTGERDAALFTPDELGRMASNCKRQDVQWGTIGRMLEENLPRSAAPSDMALQLSKRISDAAKTAGVTVAELKEVIIQNPRTLGVINDLGHNLTEGAHRFGVPVADYLKIGAKSPVLFQLEGSAIGRAISEFTDAGVKLGLAPRGRASGAGEAVLEFLRQRPELLSKAGSFANRREHITVAGKLVQQGEMLPFSRPELIGPLVEYHRKQIYEMSGALDIPAERYAKALAKRESLERFSAAKLTVWLDQVAETLPTVSRNQWLEAVRSSPELLWREPREIAQHLREVRGYLNINEADYFAALKRDPGMLRITTKAEAQSFVQELANGLPVKLGPALRALQTHPFIMQIPGSEVVRNIRKFVEQNGGTPQRAFSEAFHHPNRFLGRAD